MSSRQRDPARRRVGAGRDVVAGHLAYLVGWLTAGCVLVIAAAALLGGGDERSDARIATFPIHDIVLVNAMRRARCKLRAVTPPTTDTSTHAASPTGTFAAPLPAASHAGALRRGIVVIEYRKGLDPTHIDQLAAVQRSIPRGTIVAPARRPTSYALSATTFRRTLTCRDFDDATLDALQLFRGRFVGSGPQRERASPTG